MANYCSNFIEFRGTNEDIKSLTEGFQSLDEGIELSAKRFEMMTFTEACDKAFGLESPPHTEYNYYGTKWFDFNYEDRDAWENRDAFLHVYGDSAWGPPSKLTQELCKAFGVEATHHYEEAGNDFGGILYADKEGAVSVEEYSFDEYKYKYDRDYWWEEMMYRITEFYKTFDEFVKDHGYAYLDDLIEAWDEAHKKES